MAACKERERLRRDEGMEEEHAGASLDSMTLGGVGGWGELPAAACPLCFCLLVCAVCQLHACICMCDVCVCGGVCVRTSVCAVMASLPQPHFPGQGLHLAGLHDCLSHFHQSWGSGTIAATELPHCSGPLQLLFCPCSIYVVGGLSLPLI